MLGETKHYIKHDNKDERILAWKQNREEYNKWRRTPDAYKFISWKRKKQQNLCFICLGEMGDRINVDHIFPLYLGGTNFKGNLCLTHQSCNMDKGIQVALTYKQACHRRRQFNLMRKSKRAIDKLSKNPKTKLSKKDLRAIEHVSKLEPTIYSTT